MLRAALLAYAFACAQAQATRPMVVDDAGIAAPGECQLEAWSQHGSAQTEYWAVPACGTGAGWEFAAGGARIVPDRGGAYRAGVVHAKTAFHALETNGWGIGLTLADQFRPGSGVDGDLTVLVPLTISRFDDRLLVHTNLGWLRARGTRPDRLWAAGAEWAASSSLSLTMEAYGTRRSHGMGQAGARLTLVPERLALDAGVGQRPGGGDRYYTLGLTVAGRLRD